MGFKHKQILMEVVMKTMATIALGYFAMRVFQNFMATRNSVPLLLLVSECITIFLVFNAWPKPIFNTRSECRHEPIPHITPLVASEQQAAAWLGLPPHAADNVRQTQYRSAHRHQLSGQYALHT